jgi:hypothetical protein
MIYILASVVDTHGRKLTTFMAFKVTKDRLPKKVMGWVFQRWFKTDKIEPKTIAEVSFITSLSPYRGVTKHYSIWPL